MHISRYCHIAIQNCSGWRWRKNNLRFSGRLRSMLNNIAATDPTVIGLQECYYSSSVLAIIREVFPKDQYIVLLPTAYDPAANKRSVITILIVKMQGVIKCTPITLYPLIHSCRYNFVELIFEDNTVMRLLNIWVPQTSHNSNMASWYRELRTELKQTFFSAIKAEAEKYINSDILFTCFGDFNSSRKEDFLASLADPSSPTSFMYEPIAPKDIDTPTWISDSDNSGRDLDHILFSSGYKKPIAFVQTKIENSPLKDGLSDHSFLVGTVCFVA